jgi:hypothetical protein
MKKREQGYTMTEYLVVTGLLVAALLTPWEPSNENVIELLLDAMKAEHAGFLYAIGLPPLPKN